MKEAAATEVWSQEAVEACEQAYRAACGTGVGNELALRVESARLCSDLRWLGDRREWTIPENWRRDLTRARERAASLGGLS